MLLFVEFLPLAIFLLILLGVTQGGLVSFDLFLAEFAIFLKTKLCRVLTAQKRGVNCSTGQLSSAVALRMIQSGVLQCSPMQTGIFCK